MRLEKKKLPDRIPGARVETSRHHPECNDLCAHCVMWRHIDALRASYEAKVEDLAKETLRGASAEAEIERLRAAITLALDTMHPQGYLQSGAVKALRAATDERGGRFHLLATRNPT